MSDLLTHWAVFDDTLRLAATDQSIDPFMLELLIGDPDAARLGAIARKAAIWMPQILERAVSDRDEAVADPAMRRRIAFALGGLLHYPADFMFKPMMSRLADANWAVHNSREENRARGDLDVPAGSPTPIREISAYYDCHVFRKVYLAGQEEPFSDFLIRENKSEPGQALEQFIRSLFQRSLLASHTLSPDVDDLEAWLDNLLGKVQPLYIDVGIYSEVFMNPDPAKMKTYAVETEFYLDSDPSIVLARKVQKGEEIDAASLEAALGDGENTSGFALCLVLGIRLLREVSAYWRGDRSEPPDIRQDSLVASLGGRKD
jgi:hypothetical protein